MRKGGRGRNSSFAQSHGDLYGDDDARSRWLQLVNVAALVLHGDDRDAVKAFIDLCEAPYIN